MPQNREAEAFINRITSLPLDAALQPSLDDELELRKLFAGNKTDPRLKDPYVGLVDVFDAPNTIRTTRARIVTNLEDDKYIMPLDDSKRRKEGSPCMVNTLEEFQRNWAIFSEGALSQLKDWDNVVAAGGAVSACLAPLSEVEAESKRAIREHYHSAAYPSSDVDLFLWGMDAEQAERKINVIYEAVRDSVPWDVTCVRTKHTVSIHSQYPYRSIQIVLRLYTSPAEILAGFDIDAPCCLYNGKRVFCNPRAIIAMIRQCNTVDMSRRSPSYEVRLAKYAERGFEIHVPTLRREDIDPTIYERSITRITGLARLLVLEKLKTNLMRDQFLASRRTLRGRPDQQAALQRYRRGAGRRKKYKGDLKADNSIVGLGLEMSEYDLKGAGVGALHVPYGPGWDARRIDRLIYQTDLGMNSPYNPKNKNRRLHRHPAFFGTMKECVEDCCEHCPEPIDSDEKKLQAEEDESCIRGRITFIQENPGRQQLLTGSFNPITIGEWSVQAYIGATERFFSAIVAHDRQEAFTRMLPKNETTTDLLLHRRDHVGRTALHVAILSGAEDIACDLIDAGARITARLVDGRCALHLAAQFGQVRVVRKLLERSERNKLGGKAVVVAAAAAEEAENGEKESINGDDGERPSSEDDWSSADEGVVALDTDADDDDDADANDEDDKASDKKAKTSPATQEESGESVSFPEDSTEDPDILDVNLPDWDFGFTPLAHAIISGSSALVVETLLKAGADATLILQSTATGYTTTTFHPLTLTIFRQEENDPNNASNDESETLVILRLLIASGASSSAADDRLRTVFHRAVAANKTELVLGMLKYDPNADKALNYPALNWSEVVFPVVSAINKGCYSVLAVLLAYGAKINFTEQDLGEALDAIPEKKRSRYAVNCSIKNAYLPVEMALVRHDDVVQLLLSLGADFNIGLYCSKFENTQAERRKTIVDWVRFGTELLATKMASISSSMATHQNSGDLPSEGDVSSALGWKKFLAEYLREDRATSDAMKAQQRDDAHAKKLLQQYHDAHSYLVKVEGHSFISRRFHTAAPVTYNSSANGSSSRYALLAYRTEYVPQNLGPAYDELYEACFTGDNSIVERLCLPQEGSKKDVTPFNINVQITSPENAWTQTGYTTLFAAVRGRQWTTARLIMAISTAQYTPPDNEEKFSTKGLDPYDDDPDRDDNASDSGDSDITVEQEEITFIDIAKRASVVESVVPPSRMLDVVKTTWRAKNAEGKYVQHHGNHLLKAIYDDDLEAFTHILGLYLDSPLPTAIPLSYLETILEQDRPEFLDQYIRKTGQGIAIQRGDLSEDAVARNDKNKVYLGLNVHGKKRADLATMGNRNSPTSTSSYPLVWEAAAKGARKIVEYLAGDRPLVAYQHYASTGKDERAYQLRRVPDLRLALPGCLGWTVSNMGDSPLMAAILGKDLSTMKALFSLNAKLMASCLHECVKLTGYNALLLAVDVGCDASMVDFLLAKSVSPVVNDSVQGWNIYHVLCDRKNDILLEHMLKKLPRDVSEALLAQQSKVRLNTELRAPFLRQNPLHSAVKVGAKRASKLIVDFTTATLLMRNLDGSTPLHSAVQLGYGNITETLAQAGPPEALYTENGIGETPLDMALLKYRLEMIKSYESKTTTSPKALDSQEADEHKGEIDRVRMETELGKLRQTIEDLKKEGKLVEGTKLTGSLSEFVALMEGKLAGEKSVAAATATTTTQKEESLTDGVDRKRTLKAITEAQSKAPGRRLLVHLLDVQKSVQGDLKKLTRGVVKYEPEVGLGQEQDDETDERIGSLVWNRVRIHPEN